MARIVFFFYLAAAIVCGVITLMYPPWRSPEFSGVAGALASLAAALPWSILLYFAVYFLHPFQYLLAPFERTFGYGSSAMLFYGLCWSFVILNLYVLHRFATKQTRRVGDPNLDSGGKTDPALQNGSSHP